MYVCPGGRARRCGVKEAAATVSLHCADCAEACLRYEACLGYGSDLLCCQKGGDDVLLGPSLAKSLRCRAEGGSTNYLEG